MPLQIAIDASRATAEKPTGTEAYALHLIRALIAVNDSRRAPFQFELYFRDRPADDLFPQSANVAEKIVPMPRLWTHVRFAAEIWRRKPDITFVPAHSLPFLFPGTSMVTVHDLGYKHFPDAHPPVQRAYLDATTRYSQARAAIVLADSQATADDLGQIYGTSPNKIRVVYPGVDGTIRPSPAAVAAVRAKYQLPHRYFLFLGTLQPRKNIKRIVEAFKLWQRENSDDETDLVLAGGKGWLFDETWLSGSSHVRLTGYVDEADKAGLYGGATALVFPSLYEGFGFPALEAMLSGTPVIASNTSSLPELVGDSGLLVNPLDVDDIAAAMSRCSENDHLRRELIRRGYEQVKRFTWQAAAERVMSAFAELGGRRRVNDRAL